MMSLSYLRDTYITIVLFIMSTTVTNATIATASPKPDEINRRKKLFIGLAVAGGAVLLIGIILMVVYRKEIATAVIGAPTEAPKKVGFFGGGGGGPVDPNAGILANVRHTLFQTKMGLAVTLGVCVVFLAAALAIAYFAYNQWRARTGLEEHLQELEAALEEQKEVSSGADGTASAFRISTIVLGVVLGLALLFIAAFFGLYALRTMDDPDNGLGALFDKVLGNESSESNSS